MKPATPRVLCVMLAAGRQQMVDRAVRCFREQTYQNKLLYVLDNGPEPLLIASGMGVTVGRLPSGDPRRSIGQLRNLADSLALPSVLDCEIIAHWDSDDWSHPLRIEEQVALLTSSGAEAVGYRELLFWDTSIEGLRREHPTEPPLFYVPRENYDGSAWLYTSPNPRYCTGTSMMYWRDRWKKKPFADISGGEDLVWQTGVKTLAESAIRWPRAARMIASLHGGNTASAITKGAREWCRVPEWDDYCRGEMTIQEGATK